MKVVVAPDGINAYPKYLVTFDNVIAFTCMEEAFSPPRDFDYTMLQENNLSAYQYLESPWLEAYEKGQHFVGGGHPGPLCHYLIFGGDNNVEVVTPNVPTVDRIDAKEVLLIECEV